MSSFVNEALFLKITRFFANELGEGYYIFLIKSIIILCMWEKN